MASGQVSGLPPGYTVEQPEQSQSQGFKLPEGYTLETDTPVPNNTTGLDHSTPSSYQAAPDEQTPEGAAAAQAQRERDHPIITGIGKGAADLLTPIGNIVAHPIDTVVNLAKTLPPYQAYKAVQDSIPVINAYENARSSGASVMDSLHAANAQATKQNQTRQMLDERIAEYKKNPTAETIRGITDVAGTAALVFGTGGVGDTVLGDIAVPEASAEVQAAAAAAKAAAKSVTPADAVAAANAAKAPIAVGAEAATEAPTLSSVQPAIQQQLRASINSVATEEGLQAIPAETSVRDLGKGLGDQFYARSKDTFARVEEATGVDLNRLRDKISTLEDKIADAVDNPERAGQLEQQKAALENEAGQAFDTAKAQGLDVEQARTDWKKFNAAYDTGKQIRMTTEGRSGVGAGETVDPSKLSSRLHKMADSNSPTQPGRLQQLMGDDTANNLLNGVEQSRGAIKDFVPTGATGQKAMQQILRNNTGTGMSQAFKQALGFSPKTDFIGSLKDFNALSAEEQVGRFGADAPAARSFLQAQARWQVVKLIGKGLSLAAIGKLTGLNSATLHLIL